MFIELLLFWISRALCPHFLCDAHSFLPDFIVMFVYILSFLHEFCCCCCLWTTCSRMWWIFVKSISRLRTFLEKGYSFLVSSCRVPSLFFLQLLRSSQGLYLQDTHNNGVYSSLRKEKSLVSPVCKAEPESIRQQQVVSYDMKRYSTSQSYSLQCFLYLKSILQP